MGDNSEKPYERYGSEGGFVQNPAATLLGPEAARRAAEDKALRDAQMSYEITPMSGRAEQPTSADQFNIPRTTELGQNAIDSTIDSHETSLTSTFDGSVVERTVGYGDLLVIGNNLEAIRLDAKAVNQMPAGGVRGDKIVGLVSLPSDHKPAQPEDATQTDLGLAA